MPEKFDLVIVGSGIAGLCTALEASKNKDKSIAILDRFDGTHSNTYFAQGGIAAAVGKNDSWKKHFDDTISAGAGLCDEKVVGLVAKKGPAAIRELMDLGLEFDGGNARLELGLEGGHSEERVLHIKGDQTGKEMENFLGKLISERGNVYFLEKTFLKEIMAQKKTYTGKITATGKESELQSNTLVLATGGYAACFEKTTNPPTTLGSGIAIAHKAGCALDCMEFVQFHPTTLRKDVGGNFLVSEAVRGEGGKIIDEQGRQIIDPLDTRDKVSIAIYMEIMKGKRVFLDARGIKADFRKRFPSVYCELTKHGINPEKDLIPIETAAHYTIGGIKTGIDGQTSIRGIYAAGECSCSGLHGANRLASNSLLEGLVMGKIAGANAVNEKSAKGFLAHGKNQENPVSQEKDGVAAKTAFEAMKKVMWRCCGVARDEVNLKDGLAGIKNLGEKIEVNESVENIILRNALLVSWKTIEAALARKESVGAHYRIN